MSDFKLVLKDSSAAAAAMVLAAVLGSVPANAAERSTKASKSESVGVASGLVIGAAAGGPFGAVMGAAAGAWLGDRHHRHKQSIDQLTGTVASTQHEAERLSHEVRALNETLSTQEQSAGNVQGVVHFRTGETGVRAEDAPRVAQLGAWLSSYDRMIVRVTGYADPRGPQELNASLSLERAESVARILEAAGVDAAQLIVEARGAEQSNVAEPTLDNYAFERRVEIALEPMAEAVARID
jgi:outer membrane protein OmpA-like peptidoglycan-associated protein